MEVHFSDLLFYYLQWAERGNFSMTETPGGIKIVEWVYADDLMFIGIFSCENELINWKIE